MPATFVFHHPLRSVTGSRDLPKSLISKLNSQTAAYSERFQLQVPRALQGTTVDLLQVWLKDV